MNVLQESPLYQDLVALAREEGRKAGREAGRKAGREDGGLAVLRSFIKFRYKVTEDYFDDRLQGLNLAKIKELSNFVAEASTMAEFEAFLTRITTTPPK
jgi:predicted transposase YdaD